MAVIVKNSEPAGLLKAIKKAIDDGHIVTWSYDTDGDFTHVPEQWKHKAWFRPSIPANTTGEIHFFILKQQSVPVISSTVYAIYHGRFIEMLLAHFDAKFQNASATALPISGDQTHD